MPHSKLFHQISASMTVLLLFMAQTVCAESAQPQRIQWQKTPIAIA